MKKVLFLAILLSASLASASTITANGEYSMAVGETVKLTSNSIISVSVTLNSISSGVANVSVVSGPDCSGTKPCPLLSAMPSKIQNYKFLVNQDIEIAGYKIHVVSITDSMITIKVTPPEPEPAPAPAQAEYTLKLHNSIKIDGTNMTVTLDNIKDSTAVLNVSINSGCGLKTTSTQNGGTSNTSITPCPMMNAPVRIIEVSEGQTTNVYGVDIKVTAITSDTVVFTVVKNSYGYNSSSGGSAALNGVIKISGTVTVCPLGSENCKVCNGNSCEMSSSTNSSILPMPKGLIQKVTLPDKNVEVSVVTEFKATTTDETTVDLYRIKGIKRGYLLFIVPVNADVTYMINAQTGATVQVSRPWWSYFIW